jgi:hypothetical protein
VLIIPSAERSCAERSVLKIPVLKIPVPVKNSIYQVRQNELILEQIDKQIDQTFEIHLGQLLYSNEYHSQIWTSDLTKIM